MSDDDELLRQIEADLRPEPQRVTPLDDRRPVRWPDDPDPAVRPPSIPTAAAGAARALAGVAIAWLRERRRR